MKEKNIEKFVNEDIEKEKNKFIGWIKEHKAQLISAGVGATTVIAIAIGLKNKTAITELWSSLKAQIGTNAISLDRRLKNASLEDLRKWRDSIHQMYMNPNEDIETRSICLDALGVIDKYIADKEWDGKEIGFPVHREHGWYLSNDD